MQNMTRLRNEGEITDKIKKHLGNGGDQLVNISYSRLPRGYTDDVFLAKAVSAKDQTQHFIVKEYVKHWHSREAVAYQTLLTKFPSLGAPKLIFASDKFACIEYLPPDTNRPISANDINLLKNWILYKHKTFLRFSLPDLYVEKIDIKIHYLINKPLKILEDIADNPIFLYLPGLEKYFISLIKKHELLPQTLEHGDLEPQNLLVSISGKRLRVLDWVNVKRGSGLIDVNQFFETADELGADIDRDTVVLEFSKVAGLDNFGRLLKESRVLMLLNKLGFYGQKLIEGSEISPAKGKSVMTLFKEYSSELTEVLRRLGKL